LNPAGDVILSSLRFALCAFFLLALIVLMPAALALDDTGARAVIEKFIKSQKIPDSDASPAQHVIADLNGDGRPDIVLHWNVLGPTSGYSRMSIFLDQGRSYRTLTMDLPGMVDNIAVKGTSIVVDTKMPGPNDPRCCPSVKKRVTYLWRDGKVVMLK